MEPDITLTTEALDQMCNAVIASIPPRGQMDNESTKIGCIVRALFNAAKKRPQVTLHWKDFWKEGWPDEYQANKTQQKPDVFWGQKVRTTIGRVRDRFATFFATSEGKKFQYSAELPDRIYRLIFHQNTPDDEWEPFPAQPLRPIRRRSTIGLVFGREQEWFQGDLIAGAELGARTEGYRLVISFNSTNGSIWRPNRLTMEAKQIHGLSKECAGLIIVPSVDEYIQAEEFAKPYQALLRRPYPFVFADRRVYNCDAPLIASANENGGAMATEYLVSDHGCNRIIVVLETESQSTLEKLQGHVAFMRELYGKEFSPIVALEDEPWPSPVHFRRLLECELESHGEPVGVFATNDWIARTVYQALDDLGEAQRRRVHVTGFGGRDFTQFMNPPLVSMYQDFHKVGYEAAKALAELVSDRKDRKSKPANHYERSLPVSYLFDFHGTTVRDTKLPSLQGTEPGDYIR